MVFDKRSRKQVGLLEPEWRQLDSGPAAVRGRTVVTGQTRRQTLQDHQLHQLHPAAQPVRLPEAFRRALQRQTPQPAPVPQPLLQTGSARTSGPSEEADHQ